MKNILSCNSLIYKKLQVFEQAQIRFCQLFLKSDIIKSIKSPEVKYGYFGRKC